MRDVLVISADPIAPAMGGNAIRAVELARALAGVARVRLASPGPGLPAGPPHEPFDPLRPSGVQADVIVSRPLSPAGARALRRSGAQLVHDLYDPGPLAALTAFAGAGMARRRFWSTLALDATLTALADGHRFLCASERQRDLWIGAMLGAGLLTPDVYARDPSLRDLLDVVPFGVPAQPPRPGSGPRERFGLPEGSEIVLWNGGIWNWMDPEAAVRAMPAVLAHRPAAVLAFMGRPPQAPGEDAAAAAARRAASELGLLDRAVVFNDRWVPYEERGSWLLQAAAAISTHHDHLETRFAFRTRLLDCLWAGTPVVCSGGDDLGELVERRGLGRTVAPGAGPDAVAAALLDVLARSRDAYAPALSAAAAELRWSAVAEPLRRYVVAGAVPRLGGWRRRAARPGVQARALASRARHAVIR